MLARFAFISFSRPTEVLKSGVFTSGVHFTSVLIGVTVSLVGVADVVATGIT